MKDRSIIKLLKKNKEKALEILMERYTPYIISIVIGIGGRILTSQDIEEITSDVFYSIWKGREQLLDMESLKPYIAQIARNMTKNKFRRCRQEEPFEEDILVIYTDDVEKEFLLKDQVDFVRQTIAGLPSPDKDIIIAYYFWSFKLGEIAKRTSLPLSTVKSKLYRGRKEIVRKFEEGGYCYEE